MAASYVSFSCSGYIDAGALAAALSAATDDRATLRALTQSLPSPSSASDALRALPSIARGVEADGARLTFTRVGPDLAVIAVRNVGRNASTTIGRFSVVKGGAAVEYAPADGVSASLAVPTTPALRDAAATASGIIGGTFAAQRVNKWLTSLAARSGGVKVIPSGALYLMDAEGSAFFGIAKAALDATPAIAGTARPVVHLATLADDETSAASASAAIQREASETLEAIGFEVKALRSAGINVTPKMLELRIDKVEAIVASVCDWGQTIGSSAAPEGIAPLAAATLATLSA